MTTALDTSQISIHISGPDHPSATLAREVEYEVFGAAFGDTPELLDAEYGPYEAASVFILAYDDERERAAGMCRLILDSPAGLKSLNDVRRDWGVDPATLLETLPTGDVGSLALRPEYRGGEVMIALVVALAGCCAEHGIASASAIIEVNALHGLRARVGPVFVPIGLPERDYLGAPSLPVIVPMADIPALVADNPYVYDQVVRALALV